jgi:hypothetical protein
LVAVGAGPAEVVTLELVEVVDLELVVDELVLESSDPFAQARPVARSTAVTAAAVSGIRYFKVDSPLVWEVSVCDLALGAPQPPIKELSSGRYPINRR